MLIRRASEASSSYVIHKGSMKCTFYTMKAKGMYRYYSTLSSMFAQLLYQLVLRCKYLFLRKL